jgi:alpha-1,3-rhamnosyltransferase
MSEISVFVPSYNHARFIERTLHSIFAQTKRIKKLLVIDDGSTDESVAIIEKVLKDSPFETEFIARENCGLCTTLNEGFSKTDGEFFAYIGSDDLWLPKFLEDQVQLLESRPNAVLAFSHAFVIDDNEMITDRTDNWSDFADGDVLPCLLRGEIFASPGVVYRRSALEKYGWNENAVLEDYELYLNLCSEGEFAQNIELLCAWRRHGGNTSDDFPLMLKEHLAAQERLAERLGIDRSDLVQIQQRLKFKCVSDYIRSGYRDEAVPLFWENLNGRRSLFHAARVLTQLAVPPSLFRWNRERKLRNAIAKYGKLNYRIQ